MSSFLTGLPSPLLNRGGPSAHRTDPLWAVMDRARRGDRAALETLLFELGAPFLRTVRRVMGAHHPSVEDVAQEAALGFVKGLSNFRGECTVQHFAIRVALRTSLKARRHLEARSRVGDFSANGEEAIGGEQESPLDIALASERRRILRTVLDELSEPIAEALSLHLVLDFTVSEIADLQGVPVNTVWSRLRLGKRAVKNALTLDGRLAHLHAGGAE